MKGLSLSVKLPVSPKALPCHSHSVWEISQFPKGQFFRQPGTTGGVLPLLNQNLTLLSQGLPFRIPHRCRMDSSHAADLGRTSLVVTDGDATSLEVMGVAHGHTRLQRVRDGVHRHNHGGCSLVTAVPLLTARKGDSERDQLGAQGLEAEHWAVPSAWLSVAATHLSLNAQWTAVSCIGTGY